MKKISEWELAWHNSLKYPKHGDLLYAIREEFRQACIEAIEARKHLPPVEEYSERMWNNALSVAISAIEEL